MLVSRSSRTSHLLTDKVLHAKIKYPQKKSRLTLSVSLGRQWTRLQTKTLMIMTLDNKSARTTVAILQRLEATYVYVAHGSLECCIAFLFWLS